MNTRRLKKLIQLQSNAAQELGDALAMAGSQRDPANIRSMARAQYEAATHDVLREVAIIEHEIARLRHLYEQIVSG